jgi:hypothetical protein
MRPIKFLMKVIYANENYAKYGVVGSNYLMALLMATFYIILTSFMILSFFLAIDPGFYRNYLILIKGIPKIPTSILIFAAIFFSLRIGIKEESLKDKTFSKEYVNRAINYLIIYGFVNGIIIVSLGLKFFRYYKK